ncbi:cysteine-rich receptor-like protein kinase 21 isoform X3 [Miscanthus floridulus]|uniref:cysteine-rich receptor-like protein kinase 21 isoform X3 n=1 Tax=Miscanthus floridulus TaxID=154761 RepID=UPI003458E12A
MASAGHIASSHHRRLLDTGPGKGADNSSSPSPDATRIMVGVLVTVICCTLLYCIYCWRWRKRNGRAERRLGDRREAAVGAVTAGLGGVPERGGADRQAAAPQPGAAAGLVRRARREAAGVRVPPQPQPRRLPLRCDPIKSVQLGWSTRHNVILGIARGLLYLHEDSLLKVVHRDLKASNVLLDDKMNPKISDFGMAKIFEEESGGGINMGCVVGTYGYMAPELALEGVFSVKSDVFSFGVLLLEILSGQRNGALYLEEHDQSLIRGAWKLWIQDDAAEFMDPSLGRSYSRDEAWRCYHVGLLCVQGNPDVRPTMSSVLHMLISDHMELPAPDRPPLFTRHNSIPFPAMPLSVRTESRVSPPHSINDVTITTIEPR